MNAEEISRESVNSLDMEEYDNIWERDSTPVSEAPGTPDSATDWGTGGTLGFEILTSGWKISLVVASLCVIISSIKFKLNLPIPLIA